MFESHYSASSELNPTISDSLRSGGTLVGIGLVLTIIDAGIEGHVTTTLLAAALIGLGVLILFAGARPRQRTSSPQ